MSNINYNINDYSLNQGKKFNTYQNDYINIIGKKRLDLIEETTGNNLQSLYENMENMENPISKKSEAQITKLKSLERQFNSTLEQYKNTYKKYLDHVVQNKDTVNMYKNQNVKDANGKYYYVNEYGYTRGYGGDSWNKKPSSCLQSVPGDNTVSIYKRLQHGEDYTEGQPCNLDGQNIRNESTGHLAWVSPKGVRHYYPNQEIWDAVKKNGCPGDEIKVTNEVYNMFPSGKYMSKDTTCFGDNKESGMMNKIIQLNSKLMSLAQEMFNLIENMEGEEGAVSNKIKTEKAQLQSEISNLDNEKGKLDNLQNTINRLDGELEQTSIMTNMEYIQYIGWTIGAIGVAILAAKHITS